MLIIQLTLSKLINASACIMLKVVTKNEW